MLGLRYPQVPTPPPDLHASLMKQYVLYIVMPMNGGSSDVELESGPEKDSEISVEELAFENGKMVELQVFNRGITSESNAVSHLTFGRTYCT